MGIVIGIYILHILILTYITLYTRVYAVLAKIENIFHVSTNQVSEIKWPIYNHAHVNTHMH